MKEKLVIFLTLIILIVVLIGINAASYVQKEKVPDSETMPNRSTYNTGATGTRAFYELLAETGRRVTRWQEPPLALSSQGKIKPSTFVVIGSVKREFEDDEIDQLLAWVKKGGKLVVIDRAPNWRLLSTTTNWKIAAKAAQDMPFFNTDPSDQKQMTAETSAAKPIQPTIFTTAINAVQPSRYASTISLERLTDDKASKDKIVTLEGSGSGGPVYRKTPLPEDEEDYPEDDPPRRIVTPTPFQTAANKNANYAYATPKPVNPPRMQDAPPIAAKKLLAAAPLVHLANDKKNILVDFAYGAGRIVYLADPYIVTNNGITLVDNAQLAVNIVSSGDGLIAFDEYHQGFGASENELLAYFAGTPLVPVALQLALLVGLVFYSQSRRFARALPEDEPDRLSKLEYVAAMAQLQQRTKAFDLAIENIYTDFRRRVARSFGVDNFTTSRTDLAKMIGERLSSEDPRAIDELMRQCEDISHGEATNKKVVLELAGRLRELEEKLGLQRRKKRKSKN